MKRLFVLPSPNLDRKSKLKWFFYITCWGYLFTPFSRKGTAHAIVRDWVLSLSAEQVSLLTKEKNENY
jgi:hypothetical protein